MKWAKLFIFGAALILSFTLPCWGSVAPASGSSSFLVDGQSARFILQLVIVGVGIAGMRLVFSKSGIQEFLADLALGIVLGPTILGWIAPNVSAWFFPVHTGERAAFQLFAELGVICLLCHTGLGIRPEQVNQHKRAALVLGIGGVLVPLAMGYGASFALLKTIGYTAPGGQSTHVVALFLGNTIAVSSIVLVLRVLQSLNLERSQFARTVICGYAVNGVLGWMLFGMIFKISQGHLELAPTIVRSVLTGILTLLAFVIDPDDIFRLFHRKSQAPTDHIYAISVVLIFITGLATHALGVTLYYGVFLAGVALSRSEILTHVLRRRLFSVPLSLVTPMYFVGLGLFTNLRTEFSLVMVLYLTAAAIGFKYAATYLCATFSGRDKAEWRALAVSFTPSGADSLIFAGLAMSFGLITEHVLSGIIASAVVSSVVCGPWLKRAIKSLPPDPFILMSHVYDFGGRLLRRCDGATREEVISNIGPQLVAALSDHDTLFHVSQLATLFDGAQPAAVFHVMQEAGREPFGLAHFRLPDLQRPVVAFFWAGKPAIWNRGDAPIRLICVLIMPVKAAELRIESALVQVTGKLTGLPEYPKADAPDASSEAVRQTVQAKLRELLIAYRP